MAAKRRLAALGAAALVVAALAVPLLWLVEHQSPRVAARAPLWRVSDGDTTIWLFGSIHLLPSNVDWRTPAVEHAIADADTLLLESSPNEESDFATLAKANVSLPALEQRVSPGKQFALEAMIARSGVPRNVLESYKDWAVAVSLDSGDAMASGASKHYGVEAQLWRDFDLPGKQRLALYRVKDQLLLLDSLPAPLQREMLENTVSVKENYATSLAAWEKGDLAALAGNATCTPLDGKLIGEPNNQWARWIAWRMAKPGKLLIAVGLGHMAGPYDLTKMLAARGLKVERIQ